MGFNDIIALMLCISFVLLLALPKPQISGTSQPQNTFDKINNVSAQIASSSVILPITIPLLNTNIVPNPFAIFGTIASLFISLFSVIGETITSLALPSSLSLFLSSILTIMMLISAYSWWKSGTA